MYTSQARLVSTAVTSVEVEQKGPYAITDEYLGVSTAVTSVEVEQWLFENLFFGVEWCRRL